MTDQYRRPRGMRWQPQDVPPRLPELSYGLKACLIAAAVIVALWALGGCSSQTELVVAGKSYQTADAETCARLAAKTGGTCYARD